jgi:hypothetical protein
MLPPSVPRHENQKWYVYYSIDEPGKKHPGKQVLRSLEEAERFIASLKTKFERLLPYKNFTIKGNRWDGWGGFEECVAYQTEEEDEYSLWIEIIWEQS